MLLTQKITKKVGEYVQDDQESLKLILGFNDKHDSLLEEYSINPSEGLEDIILRELEMYIIEELYVFE